MNEFGIRRPFYYFCSSNPLPSRRSTQEQIHSTTQTNLARIPAETNFGVSGHSTELFAQFLIHEIIPSLSILICLGRMAPLVGKWCLELVILGRWCQNEITAITSHIFPAMDLTV